MTKTIVMGRSAPSLELALGMEDDRVLDKNQWKVELAAVIEDVKSHVLKIGESLLDGTDEFIYFNVTTLEGNDHCIQMSKCGFLIADTCYDSSNNQSTEYFETPYALLDRLSPKYRESFAFKLIDSLAAIKDGCEANDK